MCLRFVCFSSLLYSTNWRKNIKKQETCIRGNTAEEREYHSSTECRHYSIMNLKKHSSVKRDHAKTTQDFILKLLRGIYNIAYICRDSWSWITISRCICRFSVHMHHSIKMRAIIQWSSSRPLVTGHRGWPKNYSD